MNRNMTTHTQALFAKMTRLALSVAAAISLSATALQASNAPKVVPPLPILYSAWSAAWWQWGMEHPLEGHQFVDDPAFDVSSGQRGLVWFLATPLGTVERNVTIPFGKYLFVGLLNAEASDLEGLGATRAERRQTAIWQADHIVGVGCEVDGVGIPDIDSYRFTSPQFSFDAPTPWIFGATGGRGKSVADGYYIMLAPPSRGTHTIHVTGAFHFSIANGDPFDFDAAADVTYRITVR